MRIGIDARFWRAETGGIGRYTRSLLHELVKIDKHNQYTVFITAKDKAEYDIKAANFRAEIVSIVHYSLAEQTKFLKILNRGNFDLVHFLNFNHPIFYRKTFITTIHDLTMLFYPVGRLQNSKFRSWAFKTVMKSAVKNSKKSIAVSQTTKNDCVKYLDAQSEKIQVIHEAVDSRYHVTYNTKHITKMQKKYNITKPYILFVSQWRPHKGLPELIKAFEVLKNKYKNDIQLVVIGRPNKSFPEIPLAIAKSLFAKDIIKPGFVNEDDLPIFYQNASAFVFPSFYEGFGLPPLEAMACGAPVISSNLSCMPEVLGDAAEYFDPHKIDEMAVVINQVLTDKKLHDKMSRAGLEQVKKYSWRETARETFDIYNSVL